MCKFCSSPHSDRISCTQRIRGAELFVFIVEHGIAAGQHLIRAQGASQGRGVAELLFFVTELLLHRLLKLLLPCSKALPPSGQRSAYRFRRKRLLRLHKLIIAYFQLVLHYILNILFQVV